MMTTLRIFSQENKISVVSYNIGFLLFRGKLFLLRNLEFKTLNLK